MCAPTRLRRVGVLQRLSFRRRCSSHLCDWAGEKYLGLTTRTGSRAVFRIIRPASSVGADGPLSTHSSGPASLRYIGFAPPARGKLSYAIVSSEQKLASNVLVPKGPSERRKSGARWAKLRRSGTVVRARGDLINGNSDEIHAGDRASSGQRNDSD
jgi:hypothetical protein